MPHPGCSLAGKIRSQQRHEVRAVTEAEFLKLYKQTLSDIEQTVEDAINDHDAELDYESGNDMLTLTFRYDAAAAQWRCTVNGKSLPQMLQEICLDQGGVEVTFA
jgi:frataxin-like iron-binding protein CyaY